MGGGGGAGKRKGHGGKHDNNVNVMSLFLPKRKERNSLSYLYVAGSEGSCMGCVHGNEVCKGQWRVTLFKEF